MDDGPSKGSDALHHHNQGTNPAEDGAPTEALSDFVVISQNTSSLRSDVIDDNGKSTDTWRSVVTNSGSSFCDQERVSPTEPEGAQACEVNLSMDDLVREISKINLE